MTLTTTPNAVESLRLVLNRGADDLVLDGGAGRWARWRSSRLRFSRLNRRGRGMGRIYGTPGEPAGCGCPEED